MRSQFMWCSLLRELMMGANATPLAKFRLRHSVPAGGKKYGRSQPVADYAQKPALQEGRGMVAGRSFNVRASHRFPQEGEKWATNDGPASFPGPARYRCLDRKQRPALLADENAISCGNVSGYSALPGKGEQHQPEWIPDAGAAWPANRL